MSKLLVILIFCVFAVKLSAVTELTANSEPKGDLTLIKAISAAILHNPELKAYSSETRSMQARQILAGMGADPELELELDEFGGNKSFSGIDSLETTLKLSQLIEFGNKVSKRQKVSSYDARITELEYDSKLRDICADMADTFIELLTIQKKSEIAEEQVAICGKMAELIDKRVEAGKSGSLDLSKARIVLARARLRAEQISQRQEYLKIKLASFWGSKEPKFDKLLADLDKVDAVPEWDQLISTLQDNPDVERWAVDISKQQAEAELAGSLSKPNVKLSGGVKYFNESDGTAFMVGVGIPLRKSNRNRQEVIEAQHNIDKASQQQQSNYLLVLGELSRLHGELQFSHGKVQVIKDEILNIAKELFDASVYSFEQGKVDYLYLLDSQRSYFSIQEEYLDALAEYHIAKNHLDRIAGVTSY